MVGPTLQRRIVLGGSGAAASSSFIDPLSIPGLQLWLDAANMGAFADGDPVGTWVDRSVNGRNFAQATGANKPTYKTNIQNGLPVVRFDGTNDYLTAANFGLIGFTCFIAAKVTFAAAAVKVIFDNCGANPSANNGFYIGFDDRNQAGANQVKTFTCACKNATGIRYFFKNNSYQATAWKVLAFGYQSDDQNYALNSVAQTPYDNATAATGTGSYTDSSQVFALGATNAGSLFVSMDCAELILVNRTTTSLENINIANYMANKLGIT